VIEALEAAPKTSASSWPARPQLHAKRRPGEAEEIGAALDAFKASARRSSRSAIAMTSRSITGGARERGLSRSVGQVFIDGFEYYRITSRNLISSPSTLTSSRLYLQELYRKSHSHGHVAD